MSTLSLDALHRQKTGKSSDKWGSYLKFYDELFGPVRDRPISLLEIGVQNGGSLETWASYFRNAKAIVGCDIDPRCGALQYDDARISVVVGDVNHSRTFEAICNLCRHFDIVIDDGSHYPKAITDAFVAYFPLVNPGGMYIIEDAHTLYWPDYGGGILSNSTPYALFKALIDVLSLEFWSGDCRLDTYLQSFFPKSAIPGFVREGWIDSITFRNSIISVRKADRPGHD
jgi:hypothetical protein